MKGLGMKSKRKGFKTRIISNGTVYLYAKDCADALGYKDPEPFCNDNPDIITAVDGIQNLVSEDHYNQLLIKNPESFGKQIHLELTKTSTLNAEIESLLSLYSLKFAFAGPMFEAKAKDKGGKSVEEYIEKYDFPAEAKKTIKDFMKKRKRNDWYDKEVRQLTDERVFVPEVLERCGVTLQAVTVIEKDKMELMAFFAGDGLFYQVCLDDEYQEYFMDKENNLVDSREEADHIDIWYGYEKYVDAVINRAGELCFPVFDEKNGEFYERNIGKTKEDRDFRKHNVFENIVWAIQNSNRGESDLSDYSAPGISMYLDDSFVVNLVFHNNENSIMVEGIVDYNIKTKITAVKNIPILAVSC